MSGVEIFPQKDKKINFVNNVEVSVSGLMIFSNNILYVE